MYYFLIFQIFLIFIVIHKRIMSVIQNLTSLEFAEENAFFFTPVKGVFGKLDLYDYQKDILRDLDNQRFILLRHPRQMGITTLLKLYLANAILNTYEKPKTFVLLTNNLKASIDVLKDIKRIILQSYSKDFVTDNLKELVLLNGNRIKVVSAMVDSFRGFGFDELVIDNGNFIDNLDEIFKVVIPTLGVRSGKIILVGGNNKYKTFFKELFNNESNMFYKKKLKWDEHPDRGELWYNDLLRHVEKELLDIELDISEGTDEFVISKPKMINVRIIDEVHSLILNKLKTENLSMSEYIRGLIHQDLFKD